MPTLNVTILSAHNLVAKDVTGTSDPYCIVKCGRAKHRTSTKHMTLNPSWFESFTVMVMDPMRESITFDLYDKDLISNDDPLGSAVVQLNTLRRGVPERMSLNLMGARSGVLMVELNALDFGQAMMQQPMMQQSMMQPMMQQPMMQQPMMQPMMQQPMMQQPMMHPTMMPMVQNQPMMQPMMQQPMMQTTTYTTGYPTQPAYGVPPPMGYPPYGGGGYY